MSLGQTLKPARMRPACPKRSIGDSEPGQGIKGVNGPLEPFLSLFAGLAFTPLRSPDLTEWRPFGLPLEVYHRGLG